MCAFRNTTPNPNPNTTPNPNPNLMTWFEDDGVVAPVTGKKSLKKHPSKLKQKNLHG